MRLMFLTLLVAGCGGSGGGGGGGKGLLNKGDCVPVAPCCAFECHWEKDIETMGFCDMECGSMPPEPECAIEGGECVTLE
jgi:hypothetical protein